jgi:nucleotide-binding universal stress UspA family protein
MKHILVATDFSDTAESALAQAAKLAASTGAKLTLLHVIYVEKINEALLGLDAMEYLTRVMSAPSESTPYAPTLAMDRVRDTAKAKLEEAAMAVSGPKVQIETVVIDGRPSEEVLAYARNKGVDLIVLGTHGRGAIGKALLGSVADHVIRQAECPVMVVRK